MLTTKSKLQLSFILSVLLCFFSGCSSKNLASVKTITTSVCIYGATPAGIAAAISAAKEGQDVFLVESSVRIGGLVTNGLSHTDFHSFEALTGTFLDFTKRVENYYIKNYGLDSKQVASSFKGTFGEPKVNLLIFEEMIAEYPQITVITEYFLEQAQVEEKTIQSATFSKGSESIRITAKVFIDATYEGDLMAMAGVTYSVGREGQDVYGETLAPKTGDDQLQAYNFRFSATNDPENRTEVKAPKGYDRNDFLEVLPILDSGKIDQIFAYPPIRSIYKAQTPPLPNHKYDINDVSRGVVRLSMPGYNQKWPEGTRAERQEIFDRHIYYSTGMLYFLQHDEAVPNKYREQALEWGWCKDEFVDNDNLPYQLYVREARRMKGQYVYTQVDSEHADNDARAKLHKDAIAMGDYGNNCHGTAHEGPQIGGRHTGEFYNPVPPYQIPYGVVVPNEINNLLVPVAVSSSHVGFCALRLEPIWTSLGQASGFAAANAIKNAQPVQNIDIKKLQEILHQDGSSTIYVSDVLPGHPDFLQVQWWGLQGGLHQLNEMHRRGQRGKNLHGQYYEAAPWQNAGLKMTMDENTRKQWLELMTQFDLEESEVKQLKEAKTRGDFVRMAYRMTHQ